jgi:hypothetical protein
VEFSHCYHVLVVGSHGDSAGAIRRLTEALQGIASTRGVRRTEPEKFEIPAMPKAFCPWKSIFQRQAYDPVSGKRGGRFRGVHHFLSAGFPILCPGEVITRPIIDYARRPAGGQHDAHRHGFRDLDTIRIVPTKRNAP